MVSMPRPNPAQQPRRFDEFEVRQFFVTYRRTVTETDLVNFTLSAQVTEGRMKGTSNA